MRRIVLILIVCLIMPVWAQEDSSLREFLNAIQNTKCSLQLNHSDCATFEKFRDSVIVWFKNLNQLFYAAYQNKEQKLSRTRGINESLSMRLMYDKNTLLKRGKRTIHFEWEWGKLEVTIWYKKPSPSHSMRNFSERQIPQRIFDKTIQNQNNIITLRNLTFELGTHFIKLYSKSTYYKKRQFFTVVNDFPSSIVTQSIEKSHLLEHDKKILIAVWLINLGKQWEFEAYQQIAEIRDYYPVWLVKRGLDVGIEINQTTNNRRY